MALKQLVAFVALTVGGTQAALAQRAPEGPTHAETFTLQAEETISGKCHDFGVMRANLMWCWETALGPDGTVLMNPDRVRAGTTITIQVPDAVMPRAPVAKAQAAGSAQAPAASQQNVTGDVLALSEVARWKSQYETLQKQSKDDALKAEQKLADALAEADKKLGDMTKDRDNLKSQLGLARNAQGPQGSVVETDKDEEEAAAARKAQAEELARSQGQPIVNPQGLTATAGPDASAARIEALEREILWTRVALGGASFLVLALALVAAGTRQRSIPDEPPAVKPAKVTKEKIVRPKPAKEPKPVKPPKAKPVKEPKAKDGDPKGFWTRPAPKGQGKPSLFAGWFTKQPKAEAKPLKAEPTPPKAAPLSAAGAPAPVPPPPPAPPRPAPSPEPEPAVPTPAPSPESESTPPPAPAALQPRDKQGYFYQDYDFVLKRKYVVGARPAVHETTVRFNERQWQAQVPGVGWQNLLAGYAKGLYKTLDYLDKEALDADGFEADPTILFESTPTREFFTSQIPAEAADEKA